MNESTTKAGLVILPNNCATHATCALCGRSDRMMIPFDVFTAYGAWACGDCAAHEWDRETVEVLHGVGVEAEGGVTKSGQPEGRAVAQGLRLDCTERGFGWASIRYSGLVSVEIRDGLNPDLASVIANELLRRYRDDSQDVPF